MTPAEAMQSHLAELSEDMAKSVQSQDEQARSLETLTGEITSLREGQAEIQIKLGELSDEVGRMISLFQGYVKDTADLRSKVQKVLKVVDG